MSRLERGKEAYTGIEASERVYPVEPFNGNFSDKDIISIEQFTSPQEIEAVFSLADEMKGSVLNGEGRMDLVNSTFVELFYQPSTRTFTSFQGASVWLGCRRVIAIPDMGAYSSAVKGESLADTVRTIEQTVAADVAVLRHPGDNSSAEAAYYARIPVINAGSGRKEHPTQAILDLYTIREELGRMDNLVVTMTGDLRNGRTIKSLSKLLMLVGKNIQFNFVSPDVLKMPQDIVTHLQSRGAKIYEGRNGDLDDAIGESDVLYVTRIQSEWFEKQAQEDLVASYGPDRIGAINPGNVEAFARGLGHAEYQRAVEGYVIDEKKMLLAKPNMIVMHPLPRIGEIAEEVDNDPRAAYFRQMGNGLYTRMALLSLVLGKN